MNDKNIIFACQIQEHCLKVMANEQIVVEPLEADIKDTSLKERIGRILRRLHYQGNPIIISLPRNKATCRNLKIPAQEPMEIEKMAALQVARFLPFGANGFISGYEIIAIDKDGYSSVNVVIADKDLVENYLEIFREFKPAKISVILNSYGLINAYNYLNPAAGNTIMLVDIDTNQVEVIASAKGKLLFSRSFKINLKEENWQETFASEIKTSRDAYIKEVPDNTLSRITLSGAKEDSQIFADIIQSQTGLKTEIIPNNMFCGLLGLSKLPMDNSLNLIPKEAKEEERRIKQRKDNLQTALIVGSAILMFVLGGVLHYQYKTTYLKLLRMDLEKISREAKPLEETERRLKILQERSAQKASAVDVIDQIHNLIPTDVFLSNLSYDEDNQITLNGEAPYLNSVFNFASQLGKAELFQGFEVNIRYASQRKNESAEFVEFEIVCKKEKL